MSGRAIQPVKIVIINTQYVETDAASFKSVVQKLTGKDSTVAAGSPMSECLCSSDWQTTKSERINESGLSRDLPTLKEFDRLLAELPPMDDLDKLWAE